MNKLLNLVLLLGFTVMVTFITGCKKSDSSSGNSNGSSSGNSLIGYYTDLSVPAKQSDFSALNTAIDNNELLAHYNYGGQSHDYYADYDLFINEDDGSYDDLSPHCGRLRYHLDGHYQIHVVQIVDDNTLKEYYAWLFSEDYYTSETIVYKLYAGRIFGNMCYHATPQYYTYAKSDNKLFVSNGDIYTITSSGLIQDGFSALLQKYDPSKRY